MDNNKKLIDYCERILFSIDEMFADLPELERNMPLEVKFTRDEIDKIDEAYEVVYTKLVELEKVKEWKNL